MQQGSPKRNPESKAALESNQKLAILEFARISKSQVFPSLIAVGLCENLESATFMVHGEIMPLSFSLIPIYLRCYE
jgi:hypothetical protein